MKYLLGVDLGTSGTKTVLFNEKGETIASKTVEYELYQPKNGWAEQDPEDWYQAAVTTIKAVMTESRVDPAAVAGLSISGQMHGLVMLDQNDQVLRRAILWCDARTGAQCAEITDKVGKNRLIEINANPALPGFTACKILWVREHEPELYQRCTCMLLPKDYVRFRLTGVKAQEISDASGTISIILDRPIFKTSQSISKNLYAPYGITDQLVIVPQDNHSSETQTVSIELESSRDYVAIQTDLILPEGITLIEAKTSLHTKASHILTVREVEKGFYRLVLFSASNKLLPMNGEAIIQLTLKTNGEPQDNIELCHSLAVDAKAHEYRLNYTNKPDQTPSDLDNTDSGRTSRISIGNDGIIISSARGKQADIYTLDGKCIQSSTITTESAFYPLPAGIYVIKIDAIAEKILIK